jgi:hypothetical protein
MTSVSHHICFLDRGYAARYPGFARPSADQIIRLKQTASNPRTHLRIQELEF